MTSIIDEEIKMLRLENQHVPDHFKLFVWFLMSFQAGYINVGGFMIFGNFVSHVTGTSSQIGMGLAGVNFEQIITFFTVLISFITGAAFAGHYIGRKELEGSEPRYLFVTGVKALIFFMVLAISEYFYGDISYPVKLVLILLLSLACGIQNSTCAQATNGFLKPTHMTGLSTDIGMHFLKNLGRDKNSKEYKEELRKNKLRVGILASFIIGGSVAFFIFSKKGHYGFLFPFMSALSMYVLALVSEKSKNPTLRSVRLAQNSLLGVFLSTIIISILG